VLRTHPCSVAAAGAHHLASVAQTMQARNDLLAGPLAVGCIREVRQVEADWANLPVLEARAASVGGGFYAHPMGRNAAEPEPEDVGPEVFAADTDVVLGDACAVLLTGEQSELLRAVDAGTAYAFMSDQAFSEVGWMSAKSARGYGVDHDELRAFIVDEYLPRIAVVTTPTPDSGHWMPDADNVKDPDDVAHVQVARLIAARAVYSHDKDLRKPGHAPRTRTDYDDRVANLAAVTQRRELEHGTGMALGLVGEGAAWAVGAAARRLETRNAVVWTGVALAAAAATYLLLAPEQRRKTLAENLKPELGRLGAEVQRTDTAARALRTTRFITPVDTHRLGVQVAIHLARHPGSTMTDVADDLDLNTADKRHLSELLQSHPSFEKVDRRWQVGRLRTALESEPTQTPRRVKP
jgi:hypothetical protein